MPSKQITLGTLAGLNIRMRDNAILGTSLIWVALSAFGLLVLRIPMDMAVFAAATATMLHWASELWHHLGHNYIARRLGYPMEGITLWWFFAVSRYPRDEPELSPGTHIKRALAGPAASLLLSCLAGLLVLALNTQGGLAWWVALFFFWDNFAVFTIGAFLPLGFTDGSTLLYWLPRLRDPQNQ